MSEQTSQLVQAIRQRLRTTMRRIVLADLAFGCALILGIFCALWLVSVVVEAGFWLGSAPRTALFWTLVLVTLGLGGYYVLLPLLRYAGLLPGPSEEAVASRIGYRYPEVSDRLVNLLHLAEGRRSSAPDAMIDGAVQMLGRQVDPVPFERVEDFHQARRASRLATLPALGLLLFLLAAPSTFLDATERLFSPGATFERPAPFGLVIEPGSVELVKGEPLEITVRTTGKEQPRTLTLALQNADEDHVEEIQMTADSAGTFRHTVVNVRKSLRYRARALPVTSAWYDAEVIERPLVRSLQVALAFPSYTGIPPQRLEPNTGDVAALPGTRVSVEVGTGGQAIEAAYLAFDDGTLDTLTLDGRTAKGQFTLRREGTYRVLLRNDDGVENSDPITYRLGLLSDAPPAIVLLAPDSDAVLDEELQAGLRARINDDFGFTRLRLHYRLAQSRFKKPTERFSTHSLPLQHPSQLDQEVAHLWQVAEDTGLDPVPGDVIEYYLQVWDNDAYAGFKAARTDVQRLRLPSLAEQYRQLEETQDRAESEMEDLLRQTEEVQDRFQELRDELRRKQEADWEDTRQLESIQQQQGQMEERVEELRRNVETMTEQMERNDLVSDETLEQYRELQRVIEEVNSPELQEALRELQEAMQNLDLQKMQESLGEFEFNEQQYQQRLERTLELFKKLRMQQGLEEAARRAQELAEQQKRLSEETRRLMQEEQQPTERPEAEERRPDREAEQQPEAQNAEQRPQEGKQQGEQRPQEGEQQGEQQRPQEDRQRPQQGEQQRSQEGEQDGERPLPRPGERPPQPQQQNMPPSREQSGQHDSEQAGPRNEDLARQQERAREEMQELLEQLEELRQQTESMQHGPRQQMEQLSQEAQQKQLPQQMQQNSQQLRQNQLQQARQGQQQMQQQLEQMQQQMQQMQQQMQGQQNQANLGGMRRALEDVLTLSQQQEDLRGQVQDLNGDSPQLRAYAQRQVEMAEGLSSVADSLQQLSRQMPQMSRSVQQHTGEALREMSASTEALAERQASQASGHQKGSMMHLNELALQLSELLNQMMNARGSGSGMSMQQMLEQLQQMAGQQQQLNEGIQQLLNDMQGNRLSQSQQERLRQMAEQQQAIQRQLRSLGRDPASRGKLLGDLNKIAEQMEQTIQELQRGGMDRRTVERQQQILTRMLDAARAMQERGREKRREGQSGEEHLRESPADLTPSEQAEKLRRDLIRALESGYAPDYEELIKRYFELLQQQPQE